VVSYARYLGKTFWPANMCILYPHPTYWPAALVVGSTLLVTGISVAAIMQRHRRPWLAVGWFWYLGTLVPAIGLVQVGPQAMADRYTYLPIIGIFIALVWAAHEAAQHSQGLESAFPALGAGTALVCLVLTRHQLGYWKDSETLFRHTVEVTENNSFAHGNLAKALVDENRIDEAISEYRIAIRLWPDDSIAYNTLGNLLASQGKFDEAINEFETALKRRPKDPFAHSNLGLMLIQQGRLDDAIAHFRQAVGLAPEDPDFQNNLAAGLSRKGLLDEAVVHYQAAVRVRPDFAKAHQGLGVAFGRMGRLDDSIQELQEALRLQPNFPEAQKNLAFARRLKNSAAPQPPASPKR